MRCWGFHLCSGARCLLCNSKVCPIMHRLHPPWWWGWAGARSPCLEIEVYDQEAPQRCSPQTCMAGIVCSKQAGMISILSNLFRAGPANGHCMHPKANKTTHDFHIKVLHLHHSAHSNQHRLNASKHGHWGNCTSSPPTLQAVSKTQTSLFPASEVVATYQTSIAAPYSEQESSSSGARYHRVTTYLRPTIASSWA